jgi:hypothetical protein
MDGSMTNSLLTMVPSAAEAMPLAQLLVLSVSYGLD